MRTQVITYQLAYQTHLTISVCREHDEDMPDGYPALGPVSHGRHYGTCEVCRDVQLTTSSSDREVEL